MKAGSKVLVNSVRRIIKGGVCERVQLPEGPYTFIDWGLDAEYEVGSYTVAILMDDEGKAFTAKLYEVKFILEEES